MGVLWTASPALSRLAQKTPVASNAVQRTPIPKKPQPKNQILNNHVQSKFSKVSTLNLNQNEIQTSARKAGRKRAAPSNSTPTTINSKRARPSSPPAQKVSPKVEEEEPKKCLPTLRIKLKKDSKQITRFKRTVPNRVMGVKQMVTNSNKQPHRHQTLIPLT